MAAPKIKYAIGNAASTTTSSSMTNVQTTTPLTSTTNFQAATVAGEGMILIDEGAATEEITYATGVSGGNLTTPLANRGLEGGSAQAHSSGVSVKGVLTVGMWNDLVTSVLSILNQTTGAVDSTKFPVISGGFATTLTTTAATDVTLPTTGTLTTKTGTETLTNKRITKRVVTTTDDAIAVINVDVTDVYELSAVANATVFTLTGTPTDGQTLIVRCKDAGVGKGLTWTGFTAVGVTFPTTTVASKWHYVGCIYNLVATQWQAIAVVQEA